MKNIEQKKLKKIIGGSGLFCSKSTSRVQGNILRGGGPSNKLKIKIERNEESFTFDYAGKSYDITTDFAKLQTSEQFSAMIRNLNPHYYEINAINGKVNNILIFF